jgi:type II secretory pathway pseudopilin PulG
MLKSANMRNKVLGGRRAERGYILLTLMLFVALLTISLTALLPELAFQIKRDREEEMVHRGVQYSRAIRRYYRKFGTYPASIDLLESAQNLRFLRKRYKDPVTGQDFRILRLTDVRLAFAAGITGARNLGQPVGGATDPNASGTAAAPGSGTTPTDSSHPSGNSDPSSNSPFTTPSGLPAGDSFGGAPIVGVASTSEKETIREYNKKNHYNQWQFVYDPTSDRGGMIVGPYQPSLQSILPGQNGQPGNQNGLGLGHNGGTPGPGMSPTGANSPQQ